MSETTTILPCRILISGYYGFQNLGDELILAALLQELSCEKVKITVLSASGFNSFWQSISWPAAACPARFVNRSLPWKLIWEVLKTDCLLFGGGGLLQDVTSKWGILYYLFVLYLAKLLRKRIIIFAQGVGPIRSRFNRFLVSRILQMTSLLTVRDEPSMHALRRMGVTVPCHVTADPVFLLANPGQVQTGTRSRPVWGVCLRPWQEENFWDILSRGLENLLRKYNIELVFIPFHRKPDCILSRKLIKILGGRGKVLNWKYPGEIFSILAGVDLVIGMRYHSIILAALTGRPFLGILCDPKVEYLLESMGQQGCRVEEIEERAGSLWDNRKGFNERINNHIKRVRERAVFGFRLLKENIY